jgi:signal transduction histidine kinase
MGTKIKKSVIDAWQSDQNDESHQQRWVRLAQVLEKTCTGIWFNDLLRGRLEWDAQTRSIFSLDSNTEPTVELFWSRIHPDDLERTQQAIRSAITTNTLCEIDFRVVNPDGDGIRWIRLAAQGTYANDGLPVHFDGIIHDITPYKLAEQTLQSSHDRLETTVAENTEELTDIIDALRVEVAVREQAEANLLRLNRFYAVLIATSQAIIRAADQKSIFSEVCKIAVVQGGFTFASIGIRDKKSGKIHTNASSGVPYYLDEAQEPVRARRCRHLNPEIAYRVKNDILHDACECYKIHKNNDCKMLASACIALTLEGEMHGVITFYSGEKDFFDLKHVELLVQVGESVSFSMSKMAHETARREAEQALRESENKLVQQSHLAAMGEMINNIAHQWRQPLNILGMLVQQVPLIYDSGALNKEYLNSNMNKSMRLINHMSQTIDDFRDFYKPGKERVEFEIHKLIGRTISLVEDSFRNHHIEIGLLVSDQPSITGYPSEYSQALLNILMNARDVLLERRIDKARVMITVGSERDKSVVTVVDNAGGIAESIMGKIFEPYFSTKESNRGTGVGLFMSKRIIEENMSGKLTARNIEGGAEFRIEV